MKQLRPNVRYSPGETEENYENLSHDSQSPGQVLKPCPPEYKAGVLTTRS
jgi:hypothetical protein